MIESILTFTLNIFLVLPSVLKHCILYFVPKSWRAKEVDAEIVLITGAGSGIGRLLALDFAMRRATVIICDINQKDNEETCRLITAAGGLVHGYHCDVSDRQSVYAMSKKVKTEVGRVSILVNNAGILVGANFLDLADESIQRTFAVNALGPMWMCKAFMPDMIEANRGHIVNIASIGGFVGSPKLSDYCSSKHALIGFDECLKMELQLVDNCAVHTTVICPYFFSSGLYTGLQGNKLLQELTAETVAEEIMKGILADEEKVFIPNVNGLMVIFKHILPIDCVIKFLQGAAIISNMENFRGGREISK